MFFGARREVVVCAIERNFKKVNGGILRDR